MTGFFAAAVLYNPQKKMVLLQKRDFNTNINPGLWSFFGGSSESDETPFQTIIRELKEELNIDIDPAEIIPLYEYFSEKRNRPSHIFVILTDREKSEMTLSEGEDFDWIPMDSVFDYELTEHTLEALKKLDEWIKENER